MRDEAFDIKELLQALGVTPSKDFGQNFLFDLAAIDSIVRFGKPRANEKIIEIGGGLGALTAELAALSNLTVIEIEPEFCGMIKEKYPEVDVINSDIRLFDLAELGEDLVVFGNLPYSFSTDILLYFLSYAANLKRAVIMLQKEFSQRLFASPDSKKYGPLSIQVQLLAEVIPGPVIAGECFYPAAAVESQVVELRFLKEPRAKVKDQFVFSRLLNAAFFKRRQKIANSVAKASAFDKDEFAKALEKANISPDLRAEDISVEQFVMLSNQLD